MCSICSIQPTKKDEKPRTEEKEPLPLSLNLFDQNLSIWAPIQLPIKFC